MYNLTGIYDANNTIQQIQAVNTLEGGYLFSLLFFVLYIILILIFKKDNMKPVILAVSFIMTIIGTILFFMQLIPQYILFIPIALTLVMLLVIMFTD